VPQTAAWASVDLALLDAFGRAFGEPVSLGGQPTAATALGGYRYSGVVSAGRGWPYGELRSVGVGSVEQPIAAGDLTGLARLVRESSAEIVVDEGLTDRDSLQRFIARRACTAVNVRISKCGGLVGAYARCREALEAGLVLQVGCQVGESSLLSAAQLTLLSALAPLTPGVRYAEGCFGRHLLREDPASPLVQFGYGGRPPPRPAGAGLGVQVDLAALQRHTVDQARVT
jgi:L-alanine-DL-glutamate epimerase-like enolase superfamily enzyme